MIIVIVFCLLVLTDILEIIKSQSFSKALDKRQLLNLCLIFMGAIFGIYVLGNLFHLNTKNQVYLMIVVVISVLLILSYSLQYLKNKHDFDDLSQYMLRLCVYYRAHQKIHPSLLDAKSGFNNQFKKKVDQVLLDFETHGDFASAISHLSNHYLMKSLVEVFKSSEDVGHLHSTRQLIRLENDIENWIFQTKTYQKDEAQLRNRMLFLFGIGLLISYFAQNMLMQTLDMKTLGTYQTLIFVFLALNIFCVVFLSRRLCYSWFLKREDL